MIAADVRADQGITSTEIRLGERSAFSGPSVALGVELWRGEYAAFETANAAGGVHGRKVRLVLADDAYDAQKAAPAVARLIAQQKVFALFGGVGTPTIVKVLPVVLKFHRKDDLFQFSNFTGAQPQREPPYDSAVFNIRASYRQETRAMVDAFVAMGRKKIGVFVQDDAYGASGRDGVQRALQAHSLKLAADTTYPRGQTFEKSNAAQIALLRAAGVDAVVTVGAYQACAGFIRDARTAGWNVPIHSVSFVGADQMLELLVAEEKKSRKKLTANLLVTQVVPSYNDTNIPLVAEYRKAMDTINPIAPRDVGDGKYRPGRKYTFASLEGFVNARVFLAVLEKAGPELSRKGFASAAESMGEFDIGLGTPLHFGPDRHQALDKVWFTYASGDGWVSTDDPKSVIR